MIVCLPRLRNQRSRGATVAWLLCHFRPKAQQRLINQSIYHMCKRGCQLPSPQASWHPCRIGGAASPAHCGSSDQTGLEHPLGVSHGAVAMPLEWITHSNGPFGSSGTDYMLQSYRTICCKKQTSGIKEVTVPINLHCHAQLPTRENLNRNFQQDNY